MAGHVFVVHGDLLRIGADALLIPCDRSGEVMSHWSPYGPASDRAALAGELVGSRVSGARQVAGQALRYVDTGATPATARADWLGEGIGAGLYEVVRDVAGVPAANGRARPLVAMPVFGVGEGGFDHIRGTALRAQLNAATQAVADEEVDAVIVCFQRSDFAAMQLQRSEVGWPLPAEIREHADSLAESVKRGRMVLFLGAGVSVASGIGDFAGLVSDLERRSVRESKSADVPLTADVAVDDPGSGELPARVANLERLRDEAWINKQVAEIVQRDRYSLTHGLLASLRVREAITTNFDQLYESSCARPFAETPLEVLPWQRGGDRNPWLLKAHGDPARSGHLVLGAPSFEKFEVDRPSVAGIVRAMFALSREVLFVGSSLQDPNIAKLVAEANAFHKQFGVENPRLGTIIDIESTVTRLDENPARLGVRSSADVSIAESALSLQILLDYLAWASTRAEASWLLDERYAALLTDDDQRQTAARLAAELLPTSGNWPAVEHRLRQFGKRDSATAHDRRPETA